MSRERFRTVAALHLVLLLAILLLVASPAVAQTPTAGKAKVDRLVMGLITPYLTSMAAATGGWDRPSHPSLTR